MKTKTTKPAIKNLSKYVLKLAYCEAPYLLRGLEPAYYGAGVYGWNWDAYTIDGLIICTGYRDLVGVRPGVDVQEYEAKAAAVARDYTLTTDQQLAKIADIRQKWLNSCKWFTIWETPYINAIKG